MFTGYHIVGNTEKTMITKAELEQMVKEGVDLRYANLRGADLTGADLTDANLRLADLTGADLTDAKGL